MSESIRLLVYHLDADRRDAHAQAAAADPDGWNPYLDTSATSAQRADRASRLRQASRDRDRERAA